MSVQSAIIGTVLQLSAFMISYPEAQGHYELEAPISVCIAS